MCQYLIVVFTQIQLLRTVSQSTGPSESHDLPTDLFLVLDQSYGIHCQNPEHINDTIILKEPSPIFSTFFQAF